MTQTSFIELKDSPSFAARMETPMPIPRQLLHTCLLLVFPFTLLIVAPAASAQLSRADAFFGYSRTGNDAFYSGTGGLNGWEATVHVKMRPFLGVEGDVAHYGLGSDSFIPRTTTILVGPRVTVGAAGIKLFVHGLLGGEHSSSSSGVSGGDFAVALGGGADLPLAPFFALRVQGDYLDAPGQSPSGGDHARFTTGLVFRF
jgi:hypothetical protein